MSFPFNTSEFRAQVNSAIAEGRNGRINHIHREHVEAMMKKAAKEAEAQRVTEKLLTEIPELIRKAVAKSDCAEYEVRVPVMTLDKKTYKGKVQEYIHEKNRVHPDGNLLELSGKYLMQALSQAGLNVQLEYSKKPINLDEEDDDEYVALQIVVVVNA
jgi:hypothetical protein